MKLGNRMNVLVTGGAGLIGVPLREALTAKGHMVTAIDVTDFGRDDSALEIMSITDSAALADLFARDMNRGWLRLQTARPRPADLKLD